MKEIVLIFNKKMNDYEVPDGLRTNNLELYFFVMALDLDPYSDNWINCEIVERENKVYIWSDDSIKKQEYKKLPTMEEFSKYNRAYEEYYDKRWEEVPKIEISIQDWEQLQQKWKQIKKELPQYLVFTLDDSGSSDKIEIIGKNELSYEDIQEIQIEHEKYLKYQHARQKYMQTHSDYSDIWRGPQDDEYEADIMK
jgi:hypothetical protein